MRVTWLGHSSVKLEASGKTIYIDPYAGDDSLYSPANLVLVSQFHFDHCSVSKVRRCSNDQTHVLGTPEVAGQIFPSSVLSPGESRVFDGLEVVGMPSVRAHLDFRSHEHDKESSLGFAVLADKKTVYFMGDSDFLPKTADMKPDVLFIAVGGTYTAAPREAAETASKINPKLAIPIHWGGPVGTRDDALLFSELAKCPVKVLNPGESVEV